MTKKMPPIMRTGSVAIIIRLSYQHLKNAKKMEAMLVMTVVIRRLTFSPVAVSMAVMLVATLVTIL